MENEQGHELRGIYGVAHSPNYEIIFWGKIGRCRTVSKYKMGNFYDFGEAGSDFAIHHLPHMKLEMMPPPPLCKRLHYIAFEKELFVFRLDTEFM